MEQLVKEYFDPTPIDADCVPVTASDDEKKAEYVRMRHLLYKRFPEECFGLSRESHDFGNYYQITYTGTVEEVCFVEKFWPQTWDDNEPVRFGEENDED